MSLDAANIEQIVQKIISYRGSLNSKYIDRFNKELISDLIGDEDQIKIIKEQFHKYESESLDILSFVRTLLRILPHNYDETLYLTLALIDIFRDICESLHLENTVKASHVVDYLIEHYLSKNLATHIIPTKKISHAEEI